MKIFWVSFLCLYPAIILVLLSPSSRAQAQLSSSESRILLQVQKFLEYPQILQGWRNWTSFCYFPPSPSLKIVCSNSHVTELTIVGNKVSYPYAQTLSERFSIDSFFTVLTKLSSLKVLSLVSLGLWGPLPNKVDRFWSLEVLNISSNFIYGGIPPSISSLKSLRTLVLADNLFNGSVPDLKSLASLEELNLGGNKLGPEFPSLGNNLVRIVLKKNYLRSQIPPQIMHFQKLQEFDISSNSFSGSIPPSLFSLPSVSYINLAKNQLTGIFSVKTTCSSKLRFVDISHNLLMGKLPPCIGSKLSNRTVLYSGNCFSTRNLYGQHQNPFSYCKKEKALAVKPIETNQKKESDKKIWPVVGVVAGAVGIAVLLILLILFIWKKCKSERAEDKELHRSAYKSSRPNVNARRVPQTMRLSAVGLPPYRIFTLEEIEDATNSFDPSNLIGEGSQGGQLYKGWLRDGSVVLVNCVEVMQKNLPQGNMQYLEVLHNLRHRHLVSVIGHCVITTSQDHLQLTSKIFIVFENISNGSLRDHLSDLRKKQILRWPQRMAITIGIAKGTQFLHTGVVPGIFGNNLKIDNILLDDSLNPKVSGYKIPLPYKNGSDSTLNQIGRMNEAEKEDIYQFGVILLEVITGKRLTSTSEIEELKDEMEIGLSEVSSIQRSVVDPSIQGTYAYESMRTAVQITINCLSKVSSKRPSIEDVLWNLQYSIQVQEAWTSSGNLSTKF